MSVHVERYCESQVSCLRTQWNLPDSRLDPETSAQTTRPPHFWWAHYRNYKCYLFCVLAPISLLATMVQGSFNKNLFGLLVFSVLWARTQENFIADVKTEHKSSRFHLPWAAFFNYQEVFWYRLNCLVSCTGCQTSWTWRKSTFFTLILADFWHFLGESLEMDYLMLFCGWIGAWQTSLLTTFF